MTAYAAQLRVYEPLAAFTGAERAHWETYIASGQAPDRRRGAAAERAAALYAAAKTPVSLPHPGEHAFLAELDGVTLICPWRTPIRAAAALDDFRAGLPAALADAFVPSAVAAEAEEQLARWRVEHPDQHGHVLTSTWHVPPRWFVLVEAAERAVRLGTDATTDAGRAPTRLGRELVYRTAMSRARRRVARALSVLRRTVQDDAISAGVEGLGRWLEEFHPRSLVELDYGGLVYLLDDDELSADDSAADIADALAALAAQDLERAASSYDRVMVRMKALQAVESAN